MCKKVFLWLLITLIMYFFSPAIFAQEAYQLTKKNEIEINYRATKRSEPYFSFLAKEFSFKNNSDKSVKISPLNLKNEEITEWYKNIVKTRRCQYTSFTLEDDMVVIFATASIIFIPVSLIYWVVRFTDFLISFPKFAVNKIQEQRRYNKYTKDIGEMIVKPHETLKFVSIQQLTNNTQTIEFQIQSIDNQDKFYITEPSKNIRRKKISRTLKPICD